jgi:hypothetical protein
VLVLVTAESEERVRRLLIVTDRHPGGVRAPEPGLTVPDRRGSLP